MGRSPFPHLPHLAVARHNLLVVDGDERSVRVLEVSLRKADYNVSTCNEVGQALAFLEAGKPDLIIADTRLPDMDGFEFVELLRDNPDWADIPFMFLSSDGSIESKVRGLELGVEDYLTKPIYIREVIARVGLELDRQRRAGLAGRSADTKARFTGSLAEMGIVDLIQTIDISRKSGVLYLLSPNRDEAAIFFDSGDITDAKVGDLRGERAVYRLLLWNEGSFDVEFRPVREGERTIERPTQALLIEGMHLVDEWGRLAEQLPPLDSALEIDHTMLRERLHETPDEHNSMIRLIDGVRPVSEIVRRDGCDDIEALRKVVNLYFEGVVRQATSPSLSAPDEEERLDDTKPNARALVRTGAGPTVSSNGSSVSASARVSDPIVHRKPTPRAFSNPARAVAVGEVAQWRSKSTPPPAAGAAGRSGSTLRNFASAAPNEPARDTLRAPVAPSSQPLPPEATEKFDSMVDELKHDPEVDDAIKTLSSNPPPAPYVRSVAPVDEIDVAITRGLSSLPRPAPMPGYVPARTSEPAIVDDEPISIPSRSTKPLLWSLAGAGVLVGVLVVSSLVGTGESPAEAAMAPVTTAPPEAQAQRTAPPATPPSTTPTTAAPIVAEVAQPPPKPTPVPASAVPASIDANAYRAQLDKAEGLRGRRAEQAYRAALKINPQGSEAQASLAYLLLNRGRTAQALTLAESAAELDPASSLAWITLGAARQLLKDRDGARQAYENCVNHGKGRYVNECRALIR